MRQPLYVTFDERGRMWVVQYRQYPFPAGLKVVSYDQYIRAKFDKVPPPPPRHFRGADRVTIHEDVKGDGSFSKVKTFVHQRERTNRREVFMGKAVSVAPLAYVYDGQQCL